MRVRVCACVCACVAQVVVVEWTRGKADYALLPTIGRSGMTFEVGACPWGCLVADRYAQVRTDIAPAGRPSRCGQINRGNARTTWTRCTPTLSAHMAALCLTLPVCAFCLCAAAVCACVCVWIWLQSRRLLLSALDFIEAHNKALAALPSSRSAPPPLTPLSMPVFTPVASIL